MVTEKIQNFIKEALSAIGLEIDEVELEHPGDLSHGDYSSNIALVLGKKLKKEPLSLAIEIVEKINEQLVPEILKVEVAGAGFINFYLSPKFFAEEVAEILRKDQAQNFGRNNSLKDKLILVEYTDPNPFKQFHIGHLMSNAVGEAMAGIIENAGATVKRICYQGDVGRHVAQAIWGIRLMKEPFPGETSSFSYKINYLGQAYALGSTHYKDTPKNEEEVRAINKKIYDRSDPEVNEIYDQGREWSLEHFEEIYEKLGTKFDRYFFESDAAPKGKELVEKFLKKGVFEESKGAVIFPEEKSRVHTRVFINSDGLPTYEAKELALAFMKYDAYPYDLSLVITANEVNDYFKVLLKALEFVAPVLAKKTEHLSHGILRLPSGKMSSRTGDVITGEWLLDEMQKRAEEKMKERNFSDADRKEIAGKVAVGAIKYSILKQAIGKDIIFDMEKSLSFEGDSGPYLQYTYVRARSILEKAKAEGIKAAANQPENQGADSPHPLTTLERHLYRFPEVTLSALKQSAPHQIVHYLLELAGAFNSFYAETKIIDKENKNSGYNVALTEALSVVIKNGLNILGIQVPEKM